jgi:hypothetical protein
MKLKDVLNAENSAGRESNNDVFSTQGQTDLAGDSIETQSQ